MKDNVFVEEYVKINTVEHYFLHFTVPQKEVFIVLHGGPGESKAHLAHYLSINCNFGNFVYYDQRGTGKTQAKSKTKTCEITLDNLIEDLKQIIVYTKNKYQTDRIILLCHSWGTVLGTQYILKYPNDVLCYIGFGQVINMLHGEKIGCEKLKEVVKNSENKRDIAKLKKLDGYPEKLDQNNIYKSIMHIRKLQGKYGLTTNPQQIIKLIFKSPVFEFKDLVQILKSFNVNKNLFNSLLEYNIRDLTEYKTPIFYILGRNDWQVPSVLAADYFNGIQAPRKELFWIENAGHSPDIDNPAMFFNTIDKIISSYKK